MKHNSLICTVHHLSISAACSREKQSYEKKLKKKWQATLFPCCPALLAHSTLARKGWKAGGRGGGGLALWVGNTGKTGKETLEKEKHMIFQLLLP